MNGKNDKRNMLSLCSESKSYEYFTSNKSSKRSCIFSTFIPAILATISNTPKAHETIQQIKVKERTELERLSYYMYVSMALKYYLVRRRK